MDRLKPMKPLLDMDAPRWWPDELGEAASSGSSGDWRYAYFPSENRLLIEHNGKLTAYDAGEYQFRGAFQESGDAGTLSFMSQRGSVNLDSLKTIDL
jgi:hypothetical protein